MRRGGMKAPTVAASIRTEFALLADGALLGRFAGSNDQEAFAALVQRHGPTVLGVCRRVLSHEHDSEDAFQATFLVLARKARTISKQDSVASWLYKVAFRIALRLRGDSARQHIHEQQHVVKHAEDHGLRDVVRRELQQVLDEELHRLPEKYRTPIVLCYLQ